jgi:hypothetical protein
MSLSLDALARFKETGEEDALFEAFRNATAALSRCNRADPSYPVELSALVDVMFVYFGHMGHFAVLDCAVEMTRRAHSYGVTTPDGGPWRVRHPEWPGGHFTRRIDDSAWILRHPDGRVSYVSKDWDAWNGDGWPMGWDVRRPDDVVVHLEEEQWGDDWHLMPKSESGALTGFATIGDSKFVYAANTSGLRLEPLDNGEPIEIAARDVKVVRVTPVDESAALAMFASGMEADDVFQSATFRGSAAFRDAADAGSVLGARVFGAEESLPWGAPLSDREVQLLAHLTPEETLAFECLFGLFWKAVADEEGESREEEDNLLRLLLDGSAGDSQEMLSPQWHATRRSSPELARAILSHDKRALGRVLVEGGGFVEKAVDVDIHCAAFIGRATDDTGRGDRVANCRGLLFEAINLGVRTLHANEAFAAPSAYAAKRAKLRQIVGFLAQIVSESPVSLSEEDINAVVPE